MTFLWMVAALLAAVGLLLAVCLVRTLRFRPARTERAPSSGETIDGAAAAARLSGAIRCKTVSHPGGIGTDWAEFTKLHRFLEQSYPLFHKTAQREVVDGYSLLYCWKGCAPQGEKPLPLLLMAHQDVVPAEEKGWSVPPFSGEIREGCIWGRGAFDMKCQMIALLEAAEQLLREGVTPRRDVYFCFTHNEEVTPETGAQTVSALLKQRNIRFSMVLDEGGYAFHGADMGMDRDGVRIGLCEKGYADLRIFAKGEAGHSSMPPRRTALGTVCAAVEALQSHPPRPKFNEAAAAMYDAMAPYMPFGRRFLFANRWLFGPVLLKKLVRDKQANAALRTTFAPTMAKGSAAANVLPQQAEAVVNVRIAPGESTEKALAFAQKAIRKTGASAEFIQGGDPTPISPATGESYRLLCAAARETFPEMALVPYAMMAATDSRYFTGLSDCVYRFSPFPCAMELLGGMHAANERVTLSSLEAGTAFFLRLLRRT